MIAPDYPEAVEEDQPMPQTPRFSRAPRLVSADADGHVTNEAFELAIGMLLDQVADIKADQAHATAEALAKVATDPAIIRKVLDQVAEAAHERATRAAGQGVWWLIKNVLSRWVVIGFIVVMAAKVVGWDIAAKLGKWLGASTA